MLAQPAARDRPPRPPAPAAAGQPRAGAAADLAALAAHRRHPRAVAPPLEAAATTGWCPGARSITGKPLLANDPHLAGQAPAVWYLAHVSGGALDAIGATLPGVPGVMIGRNQRIAWGITALLGDVQDLYVEKHEHAGPGRVRRRAGSRSAIVRETIKVRGGADVPLRVRITRHGPIISDVLERPQSTLALRWTGLDAEDATAECFMRVNLAGLVAGVHRGAAPDARAAAQLRLRGRGRQHRLHRPGRVPGPRGRRRHGGRCRAGRASSSGAVTSHESEWPSAFNPARGYLASANNKVAPDSFPFMLGSSWEAPYRAARIVEMIERTPRLAVEDMRPHAARRAVGAGQGRACRSC